MTPIILKYYKKWKQDHPDEGYRYDEINSFFDVQSRGDLISLLEWALKKAE